MKHLKLVFFFYFVKMVLHAQVENAKFDKFFKNWKEENKPGVVGGAIKDGKVIFLKAFGSADISNNKRNTIQTKFEVDDLAKQFTVLATFLLVEEGKISLEDDIRRYIPKLPNYKYQIKVKHLLNHSSGLHNLDPIKELLGIRSFDTFTQEDALKIIQSQEELDFIPGTEFSYMRSDTEIILLSEIIAKASEKSFIEFTSERVFKPLGMLNTAFNNERELLDNVAISYRVGEEVLNNPVNNLTLGATNLYTTGEDLAKWFQVYTNSSNPLNKLVKRLDDFVKLDNGEKYNSSWGTMTYGRYFDHLERGLESIWQFGINAGYASNMFRFYTKGFVSFVLGNNNRYNGMPAMSMAYEDLKEEFPKARIVNFKEIKTKRLSKKQLEKFEGFYWKEQNGVARHIYVKNDTLRYKRLESGIETALVPLDDNRFQFVVNSDDEVIMTFKDNSYYIKVGVGDAEVYKKYKSVQLSNTHLEEYVGLYYNDELGVVYELKNEEDKLIASNFKNDETIFYTITNKTFRSNTFMLSCIELENNGFYVKTDGVRKLFFKKLD
ncbi:serine hydrolase domain-containing protein [uncultured Tenacibaculum sp.]|uniref:serine hydrolase domain-containing protein n=1 Tax=uncultured Tenacibaculum sp. TaxID=174713 RepID=UPI0026110E65|nr:serine hydrolase domain-containing protein [uncultured Tenacibaculum sp.]